jgi:hypothetical protein
MNTQWLLCLKRRELLSSSDQALPSKKPQNLSLETVVMTSLKTIITDSCQTHALSVVHLALNYLPVGLFSCQRHRLPTLSLSFRCLSLFGTPSMEWTDNTKMLVLCQRVRCHRTTRPQQARLSKE